MSYTKKHYCENTIGDPPYGLCKQDKYHHSELHIDHIDGNPSNNDKSNLQTICSNCHGRKTHFMGDDKTLGRGTITQTQLRFKTINDNLIDLFLPKKHQENRRVLRGKYFTNPFKLAYGNGRYNCLQGPTAFGKTYGTFTECAPYHFSKGGRVHIALSPMTDSQGYDEIRTYVEREAEYEENNQRPILYHSDMLGGINWTRVLKDLKSGYNVTIVMSDQYLDDDRGINMKQSVNVVDMYDTLVTRDEASYGMLSNWEIAKDNNGHKYPPTAKSKYYKNIVKLKEAGAHIFGITATPTREMRDKLFGADWYMANEIPNSIEFAPYRKWYRHLTLADWSHDDYGDATILPTEINSVFIDIESAINTINQFNEAYQCGHISKEKITALIVAQTDQGSREKIRPTDIVEFLSTPKSKMPSDHTLITADATGWKEYNSDGELVDSGKGEVYQDKLNDPDEKAHYLVVMNKAIYGVNIKTLGKELWFRQYQNADSENAPITHTAEQGLGRMNRPNFSLDKIVHLTKTYGYYAVYEYFSILGVGVFDVKAPRGEQFESAFESFKENHGTHMADAFSHLFPY